MYVLGIFFSFKFCLTSKTLPFGAKMKPIALFIAVVFSTLLVGQSHAQSSWGTQDTSINWIGFNWQDLGLGGYDTATDGWGTIGTNLDLGNLDSSLSGLTVSIAVGQTDSTTTTRWTASNGTTLSTARSGGTSIKFQFSGPVAFRRRPASAVAFGAGEIETYSSTSIDYMEQGLSLIHISEPTRPY